MTDTRAELVESFFIGTGHSYETVVRYGTFGIDAYWKRKIFAKVPPAQAILDLACGTGIVSFGLLKRNPNARLVGLDVTADYLQVARAKAQRLGANIEFIHANAENVSLSGRFDCITSSYIPKYVDANKLLKNISPALRSGGKMVLHDFAYPRNAFTRTIWHGYNRALNFAGKRVFPEWQVVFDNNLTALIMRTNWVNEFATALPQHGYVDIEVEHLTFGSAAIISARKL